MIYNKEHQESKFEKLISNDCIGFLEKLTRNNQATHVYRKNKQDEFVLDIKLIIETPSQRWNLNMSNYSGVIILWLVKDIKFMICHTGIKLGNRTSTLLNRYQDQIYDQKYIRKHLIVAWNKYGKQSYDNVLKNTKYKVLSREEIKANRPSTNLLEANAHDEIMTLLGGDSFKLTPEKCRADAGYASNNNFDKCIAIQTKSATIQPQTGKMNTFHNTSRYIGTVIIPGSLIDKENFKLEMGENTKYCKYLVPDVKLANFMKNLYVAISNNQKDLIWPSGIDVDISSIILNDFSNICIPNLSGNILENESQNWRQKKFNKLQYKYPRVQATTVDVIINGVTVQDKHGNVGKYRRGSNVMLDKNNGRGSVTRKTPYEIGDFEALWVFLNHTRKFIFIIPASVLEARCILKSDKNNGGTSITCYHLDYQHKWGRSNTV